MPLYPPASSGSGSALTVKDEGSDLDTAVTSIDAVGAGVTATNTSHAVTLTVPGQTFTTPAVVLGTAAAAGAASTGIRSDSTIVAFDATAPTTQAFGDSAAAGSAAVAARRDHKHAMPATPKTVATDTIWDAAGDLAVGSGADTAAKLTKGSDSQVLTISPSTHVPVWATPGTGAVATDAIFDAKGDLAAGTGADTAAKLTVGADDTILMADSAQSTGLKWVASQTPSTQAFSDSATQGTADTYARGDHKHGMMAAPAGSGTLTTVKDEGSNLSTAVASIDFVGAGVTATGTTAVTVTIPGGGNLASASTVITAGDYTTGSATFVNVDGTNLALTITTGARRVLVVVVTSFSHSVGTYYMQADIEVDGTRLGGSGGLFRFQTDNANIIQPCCFSVLTDALSAGSHTFKLQWLTNGATATMYGSTTLPLRMAVIEQYA